MLPKARALQRMEELDGVGREARRLLEWVAGEMMLAELALVTSNPVIPGHLQKGHDARLLQRFGQYRMFLQQVCSSDQLLSMESTTPTQMDPGLDQLSVNDPRVAPTLVEIPEVRKRHTHR